MTPHSRSGFALVITLSLLVLVTVAVLAFFSRATTTRRIESSRANQVLASVVASSGASFAAQSLVQEIGAGSDLHAPSGTFRPKSPSDMIPRRNVKAAIPLASPDFLNLIRQSNATASTGNASSGAPPLDTTFWNAPLLLGGTGFSANTQLPDWIYLQRDGSTSNTPDSNTIGRFAFNMYDIGGLLDVNAFGHGDGLPTSAVRSKGTPIAADLTALPGIASNPDRSNSSVSWPPTWRLAGDWAQFTPGGNGSYDFYHRTGWRSAFADGANQDRRFASRQDLIRFARANPGTFLTSNGTIPALQYLTHWTRDLDAPSHEPDPNRPKVAQGSAGGGNDAYGLEDALNPSLLRALNRGNKPALTRRFPLSRLALLSTPVPGDPTLPPPDASETADIKKFFGLTWNGAANRWEYSHNDPSDILPLSDVPDSREPDFFELLKAGISVGSLGKQFGIPVPAAFANLGPARLGGEDASVNYQIVQIAANIIDQADADSYPTRILFDGREFYGVEDLPRINRGRDRSYPIGTMTNFRAPPAAGGNATNLATRPMQLRVTMLQPQVWNPHAPSPNSGSRPTNFRIVAEAINPVGIEGISYWTHTGAENDTPYRSDFSRFPNGTPLPGGVNCNVLIPYNQDASISFTATAAMFREPTFLSEVGLPSGSNSTGSPNPPDMALDATIAPGNADTIVTVRASQNYERPVPNVTQPFSNTSGLPANFQALGFVTGYLPMGVDAVAGNTTRPWLNRVRSRGGPISLILQYQDSGGNWWPIDRLNVSLFSGADSLRFHHQQAFLASRVDARTDRWGSFFTTRGFDQTLIPHHIFDFGITLNPAATTFSGLGGSKYNSPTVAPGWAPVTNTSQPGRLQRNSSSDGMRYTDPDGVQRRGTAAYAADAAADGWPMIANNTNSRPVVLNRPFRSVAELANVFRGTPWRNLDFMTPESGDRVLLDVFTVDEVPSDNLVAGRVNLNTRQVPVVEALLRGAGLVSGGNITDTTANDAARELVNFTNPATPPTNPLSAGPLRDRSELVGRFVSGTTFSGPAESMGNQLALNDRSIQRSRDILVASLADVGTVRTWNVLIDLVAQSGTVSPGGTFIPGGQARIWQCLAIDRFTGRVLETSTENVAN